MTFQKVPERLSAQNLVPPFSIQTSLHVSILRSRPDHRPVRMAAPPCGVGRPVRRQHGPAYAGLYGLPRQTRPCRPWRLLPATGGQTSQLPLQPALEFSGWPASLRPDDGPAGATVRRLFAGDRAVLLAAGSALPAARARHSAESAAGAGPAAGDTGRCKPQNTGLRSVSRPSADRGATQHPGSAGPATGLPERPTRRLANQAAARPGARLHGAHSATTDAAGRERRCPLAGLTALARQHQASANPATSAPQHAFHPLRQRARARHGKHHRGEPHPCVGADRPRRLPGPRWQLHGLPHHAWRTTVRRWSRYSHPLWHGVFQQPHVRHQHGHRQLVIQRFLAGDASRPI